ncbi:MAG: SusC/RagA family TonB-linked outer membrane protein [Bacteroidota bacterium]
MNRIFYFLGGLLLILIPVLGMAQTSLSGTITDAETGAPLVGVSIVVVGGTTGTLSDDAGTYRLPLPVGAKSITYSYFGYKKETVAINGRDNINVQLETEIASIDEVVVIGYGTSRKRELVGSVAKIKSDDLNETIGGSFENALQGKAAGVQLTQSSGVAGAGSVIRVRGVGSLSSGGDPLFVIDGIPITQDPFMTGETGGLNNNPLSSINPDDIESVEILKDASAAAIYGSRGSNGVILITTKRGKSGKPAFSFKTRVGFAEPTNVIGLLNAEEWVMVQQEAFENDGGVGRVPLPQNLTYQDIKGIDTDWIDEVLQTGLKQEYNLSMKQGGKKLKSYVGLSYSDSESYQKGNTFQRITGRANLDYAITPKLDVGISSSIARGLNDRINQAWSGGFGAAISTALPIYPIKDQNGDWFNIYGNPVAQRELQDWKTQEWRSINNFQLTYKPINNLNIKATASYDYMDLGDYFLEDSVWTTTTFLAKRFASKVNNWSSYLTANYDWKITKEHRVNLLGGVEYQASNRVGFAEEYSNVFTHLYNNPEIGPNDTLRFEDFEIDRWRFASLFARVNYSWKEKVFVQGTFRRDGSSKFGKNRRFGNFPAVGVGYIMSDESWFKNSVVNYLKWKASWGIVGNADISWREQFPSYFFSNLNGEVRSPGYNDNSTRHQSKLDNPNLQWEVSTTYDGGFELGLLNDRIVLDLTAYYKLTTDAIINISIQNSSGIDNLNFSENVGKIENKGVEATLTTVNLTGDFQWKTILNFVDNNNKVLEVGTATPDALDGGFGDTRAVPGYPVSTNFIVRFSHIDEQTGRPVYLTREGEETSVYSVVENRVAAGSPAPDFSGGITNTFSYKNINLTSLFVFVSGGTIYDDAAKRHLGVVTEDWNMRREVLDRWQVPGDVSRVPRLTRSMINWGGNANFWQNNHTLWMEDASYIRLRNLALSYNFGALKALNLDRVVLTFSGTNLMTWTNYSGIDPEVARDRTTAGQRNIGGTNITYLTAPQEKSYNISLKIDF